MMTNSTFAKYLLLWMSNFFLENYNFKVFINFNLLYLLLIIVDYVQINSYFTQLQVMENCLQLSLEINF